ncbi:MAG: bifunctional diaminohydroxyphosphoribosylaminopyrimidine deaminase/5-amino-6-(5-phosphoribosylamino)uracil reductase RibD [Planctomycetales bacterium]|nr:bifunctional diaminohydroxyphosphoribosylaminopyrimidine deaminase/5-amino-6-(5-phosphoribosylamino)uracil reductase RibD [Planctomycetales bacterium]
MPDRDAEFMRQALDLAARGQGHVEPNPMVGALLVKDGQIVGQGWHRTFGGPHAEVEAFRDADAAARDATLYVTLEPCCHHGKTPPCTEAILAAGVRRVVVALEDPFAQVAGRGIEQLRQQGVDVAVGCLRDEAESLCTPYLKLRRTGRPWVIAKWAMSLDGKIATHTGESQWISNEASRAIVHQIRGRMDAILVGRGTVEADDPLLTARPPGARIATRIVLDSQATLSPVSRLVKSAGDAPVLVAVGPNADPQRCQSLINAGCEVLACPGATPAERLDFLLADLGRREMTNLLVEGGAALLGSFFDGQHVDELHVFIAPKILGGRAAAGPVGGEGVAQMAESLRLENPSVRVIDGDTYIAARCRRNT